MKISHQETMALAESLSNEALFNRQVFAWAGNNTLGSYFVSSLSGHYDWAVKKVKVHVKKQDL